MKEWNEKWVYMDKYQKAYSGALLDATKKYIESDLTLIFVTNFNKMIDEIKKTMCSLKR